MPGTVSLWMGGTGVGALGSSTGGRVQRNIMVVLQGYARQEGCWAGVVEGPQIKDRIGFNVGEGGGLFVGGSDWCGSPSEMTGTGRGSGPGGWAGGAFG
ncbi:hypothetical protein Tco_1376343 [Tanacetum coccineum]